MATEIITRIKAHCSQCGCSPLFGDTTVIFRHENQLNREVVEAFHIIIMKDKNGCISQSSVWLSKREARFLKGLSLKLVFACVILSFALSQILIEARVNSRESFLFVNTQCCYFVRLPKMSKHN